MRLVTHLAAAPACAAALALAACGGDGEGSSAPSDRQQRTGPEIGVVIVEPRPGERITGDTIRVRVDLAGFRIDRDSVGEEPEPDTGHLHFVMDGGRFDRPRHSSNDDLLRRFDSVGKYTPAFDEMVTYRRLPKGRHRVRVELTNNDHTSAGPTDDTTFVLVE